jgi:hypothetical protein
MSKYLALAAVLCGSLSVASAAKLKIKEFTPVHGASQRADGMAFITQDEETGCTDVQVHVSDLAPDAVYGVMLGGGLDADVPPVIGVITNAAGNGHLSIECLAGQTLAVPATVTIYFDANHSGSYDNGEERLVGSSAQ